MTYDELSSLPYDLLKARVRRLGEAHQKSIPRDTRGARATGGVAPSEYYSAKRALDSRREMGNLLKVNQERLRQGIPDGDIFYKMTKKQLTAAYQHHLDEQRKLFKAYLYLTEEAKEEVIKEVYSKSPPSDDVVAAQKSNLSRQGLSTMREVLQSIATVPYAIEGGETTLETVVGSFVESDGDSKSDLD